MCRQIHRHVFFLTNNHGKELLFYVVILKAAGFNVLFYSRNKYI